ncbi:hypothetical protein ITP53_16525 [Nonomuraea sp. K274]|uniref:Uncharacterized protein n=1 Tax=Nonomuraea cypriaca TaxID=1187855 RepID=A0A931AB31_9ACTN|nr:hypothetical protein [Nonomuraea cypriaca]MBF8187308.1 hypothetical protein [Nonomuraea cypriaca]
MARKLARARLALRMLQKGERLARLARGEGKPGTRAELDIWAEGVRKRFGIADDDVGRDDDA